MLKGNISTYLCKVINFILSLIPFPRHEHEFVLQLPQVLQRVVAHLPTIIMLLHNLQLQGGVKAQLDKKNKSKYTAAHNVVGALFSELTSVLHGDAVIFDAAIYRFNILCADQVDTLAVDSGGQRERRQLY